jgi:valyl-tRNA synthetase
MMKIGRRLAIKVLNAAKFVLSFEAPAADAKVTEPIDQSLLLNLAEVVRDATTAFENYDHTKALELAEKFFWNFTDDYLELVKERAYGQGGFNSDEQASALVALRQALLTLLRLFAPFLPFATDEIWSWWQVGKGSIHRSSWPTTVELEQGLDSKNLDLLPLASQALFGTRKAKSDAKASMKADVISANLVAPKELIARLELLSPDLKAAGRIAELTLVSGEELAVTAVVLAEPAKD